MSPQPRRALFLHEELLLLALRDREGTVPAGAANFGYAIGGALLAELLLGERLRVRQERKRALIDVARRAPVGEPLLDECLRKVVEAKRRATAQAWVSRFARLPRLKHRVAQELCALRVLRADEDRVLFLFRRKIYPEVDPAPERELIERLRAVIFGHGREVEPRTALLLSLAHASGLLRLVFDRKQLKRRKARIQGVVEGELVGGATKAAIEAAQAALVVTTAVVPAITASS